MQRFDCLKKLAQVAGDALVVSSAGAVTLEWNALRPGDGNFRVRTLGLCSSIALGMALGLPERRIIALDGDGSEPGDDFHQLILRGRRAARLICIYCERAQQFSHGGTDRR